MSNFKSNKIMTKNYSERAKIWQGIFDYFFLNRSQALYFFIHLLKMTAKILAFFENLITV